MKQVDRTKHESHLPGSPLPSVTSTLQGGQLLAWALVPLRLFLGITFVYAGIQKLTDPQYSNPEAPGYIGKQIMWKSGLRGAARNSNNRYNAEGRHSYCANWPGASQ
jgi:DoxX